MAYFFHCNMEIKCFVYNIVREKNGIINAKYFKNIIQTKYFSYTNNILKCTECIQFTKAVSS